MPKGSNAITGPPNTTILRNEISKSLERIIRRLNHHAYPSSNSGDSDVRLLAIISKSLTFPKINNDNNNKKPHDVETRIALTLYHQWKRDAVNTSKKENHLQDDDDSMKQRNSSFSIVTMVSDLGLSRQISNPKELADLVVPLLEEDMRNHPHWSMIPDVRSNSGIIYMISSERSKKLRLSGRLPCPYCIQWCKGEKGLWWHQQQSHKVEYSSAVVVAQATIVGSGAMVVYNGSTNNYNTSTNTSDEQKTDLDDNDDTPSATGGNIETNTITFDTTTIAESPMELIRQGNLQSFQRVIKETGYDPSKEFDAKGATALMWAAGGGHVDIARYLVEECHCDPCQSQKGKRSFAGRTALHWAARNGHLNVVSYLLSLASSSSNNGHSSIPIHQLLEAKTRDGTTAFGWACWQRHLPVMECLFEHGCDIHVRNSYGCSPVLWCSQGTRGNGLACLKWLRQKGCDTKLVNHNGHGVLHKAAQRGQRDVAEWLVLEECGSLFETKEAIPNDDLKLSSIEQSYKVFLAMIGPDVEGYCPSDLAGMEGHEDFAQWLVIIETRVCQSLKCVPEYAIPDGYSGGAPSSSPVWEQYGGLRRMRSALVSMQR